MKSDPESPEQNLEGDGNGNGNDCSKCAGHEYLAGNKPPMYNEDSDSDSDSEVSMQEQPKKKKQACANPRILFESDSD